MQRIIGQLLRWQNNQGVVLAGQQGWGGKSGPSDLNHGMADRQQTGGLLDTHHIGVGGAGGFVMEIWKSGTPTFLTAA
ncbi:hypothetical protein ACTG2K_14670 [Aeromonas caviae]